MSNNKNYKEIVEKRRASILKKREAKVAKKQAILEKLDSDIDYLNKVRKTVEKRKDTISKKQFIKDLLNAGLLLLYNGLNRVEVILMNCGCTHQDRNLGLYFG